MGDVMIVVLSVCNKNFEQKGQIDVGGDDKYHSLCRKCC